MAASLLTSNIHVMHVYCPVQADIEESTEQEAAEAVHHSLSPAERSALVETLPSESKAVSMKCLDALGGLDSEASSFLCHTARHAPANRWLSCLCNLRVSTRMSCRAAPDKRVN